MECKMPTKSIELEKIKIENLRALKCLSKIQMIIENKNDQTQLQNAPYSFCEKTKFREFQFVIPCKTSFVMHGIGKVFSRSNKLKRTKKRDEKRQ